MNNKLPVVPRSVVSNKFVNEEVVMFSCVLSAVAFMAISALDLVAGLAYVTFFDRSVATNELINHAFGPIGILGHFIEFYGRLVFKP